MVFGVAVFVLTYDAILTVDTSDWAFTGHEFVISFLPAMPYLLLIGLIAPPSYFLFREVT